MIYLETQDGQTILTQDGEPLIVTVGLTTVAFYDETGLNPLPAGLFVTVYAGVPPLLPANIVGTAYLLAGGVATFANIQPNSVYTATFSGAITQVPPASFL